ncbi:MAG: CHAD domain-containing protein [Candidatus Omnitrophota bacterium]
MTSVKRRNHDLAERLRGYLDQYAVYRGRLRRSYDVETVHRMRVLTRRLRTLLDLTRRVKDKKIAHTAKTALIEFRRLGRLLGDSRGLDVSAICLRRLYGARYPQCAARLGRDLIRRRKNNYQADLTKLVGLIDGSACRRRLCAKSFPAKFSDDVLSNLLPSQVKKIQNKLRRTLERPVALSKDLERLHRVRILVKKLRYNLENLSETYSHRPCYLNMLKLKKLQRVLGNWHDEAVLLDWIKKTSLKGVPKRSAVRLEYSSLLSDATRRESQLRQRAILVFRRCASKKIFREKP